MGFAEKIAEKLKISGDATFQQHTNGDISAVFAVNTDSRMFRELLDRTNLDSISKLVLQAKHFFHKTPVDVEMSKNIYGGETIRMSVDGWNIDMKNEEQKALQSVVPSSVENYVERNFRMKEQNTAKEMFQDISFEKDSARTTKTGIEITIRPDEKTLQFLRDRVSEKLPENERFVLCMTNSGKAEVVQCGTEQDNEMQYAVTNRVFLNQAEISYLFSKAQEFARNVIAEEKTVSEPEQKKAEPAREVSAEKEMTEKPVKKQEGIEL